MVELVYHRQELRTGTLYVVLIPHIVAHKPTKVMMLMYVCACFYNVCKYSKTFCKRIASPDPQRMRMLNKRKPIMVMMVVVVVVGQV